MNKYLFTSLFLLLFCFIIFSTYGEYTKTFVIGEQIILARWFCELEIRNVDSEYSPNSDEWYFTDPDHDVRFVIVKSSNWTYTFEWVAWNKLHIKCWNRWGTLMGDWEKIIVIDNDGPTIRIKDPKDYDAWKNNSFTLEADAFDNYGSGADNNTFSHRINSGNWKDGRWASIDTEGLNTGSHMVTYRVADKLGNVTTQSFTIRIDKINPTLSFEGNQGWQNAGSVTVYAAGEDTHSRINSATWQKQAGAGNWSAEGSQNYEHIADYEGETIVSFRVKDNAGNSSDPVTGYTRIDRTPPEITVSPAGWLPGATTLSITADDRKKDSLGDPIDIAVSGIHEISYSSDGQNFTTLLFTGNEYATADFDVSIEGTTVYEIKAIDNAGNETIQEITVQIDSTAPSFSAVIGTDGWINNDQYSATAACTDNTGGSGIASILWGYSETDITLPTIDNGDGTYSSDSVSSEGETITWFKVTDRAGNITTASCEIKLDRTKPVINSGSIPDDWQKSSVSILLNGSDTFLSGEPGSGVGGDSWIVSEDSTNWQPANEIGTSILYTINREGTATTWFQVSDNAGNFSDIVGVVLKIDTIAPSIMVFDTSWIISGTNATVLLDVSDESPPGGSGINTSNLQYDTGSGLQPAANVTIDGTNWTAEIQINGLPDGEHVTTFQAEDNATNISEATCLVKTDFNDPTIDTSAVTAGWSNSGNILITFNDGTGSGIDYGSIQCLYEDNSVIPVENIVWFGDTATILIDRQGTNSLELQISDNAGRTSEQTEVIVLNDTEKPLITAFNTDWINDSNPWVIVEVSDPDPGSGVTFVLPSFEYTTGTNWVPVFEVMEENNELKVRIQSGVSTGSNSEVPARFRVYDDAGNVSEEAPCVVKVDQQDPSFDVSNVPAGWTNNNIIEIGLDGTGSGINPSSFMYGYSSSTVDKTDAQVIDENGEWKAIITIPDDGDQTIWFTASDSAGNTPSLPENIQVKIDTQEPGVVPDHQVLEPGGPYIVSGNFIYLILKDPGGVDGSGIGINSLVYGYNLDPVNNSATGFTYNDVDDLWIAEVPAIEDGLHTLNVRVADNAGTVTDASFPVQIDKGEPIITITGPSGWTNTSFIITAYGIDDTGDDVNDNTWAYQVTGEFDDYIEANWISISASAKNQTTLYFGPDTTRGTSKVWFSVRDYAWNTGISSGIIQFDNSLPEIVITGISETWSSVDSVTVGVSGTDTFSGINPDTWEYRINEDPWEQGTSIDITTEGDHLITFHVTDLAGNWAEKCGYVRIDRSTPFINQLELENIYCIDELKITNLIAQDDFSGINDASWSYRFDDTGSWEPLSFSGPVSIAGLDEGEHLLNVSVTDNVGETGYSGISFTCDRQDPIFAEINLQCGGIPFVQGGYIPAGEIAVTINASDNVIVEETPLRIAYVILQQWEDDPDFSAQIIEESLTFIITGLIDGTNYLYVKVIDYAGNESDVISRIIKVDSEIPVSPDIICTTHPEAETIYDAIPFSDAIFIITQAQSVLSGIAGYEYTLYNRRKCINRWMAIQSDCRIRAL